MSVAVDLRRTFAQRAVARSWPLLLPVPAAVAAWLGVTQPRVAVALALVAVVAVTVALRPALAAYALIVVTPLTAGIDRGSAIPLLRPNEAVAALVGGALLLRWLVTAREGWRLRLRLTPIEWSLLAMAVASSVLPLMFMTLRQRPITSDDLLYALVMWKFAAVYLIVRVSIRTEHQVRWCLKLSIGVAAVVAVIAILQALGLAHVREILSTYFVPNGNVGALANPRGGATLALPAAVADVMIYNLAVLVGLSRRTHHAKVLACFGVLFVIAAVSAGEFSSAIGLVIGAVVAAIIVRRPRMLLLGLPLGALAALVAWPIIAVRLTGFGTASGLPESWAGRLRNLQSYFWPQLTDPGNLLLGVRPSARVVVPSQATGYVWIESGYTWLVWGGGIPLLLAFVWFVWASIRHARVVSRARHDSVGAAATGLLVGVVVMTVLMLFDPHLTYRGAADALFILAALAQTGQGLGSPPAPEAANTEEAVAT